MQENQCACLTATEGTDIRGDPYTDKVAQTKGEFDCLSKEINVATPKIVSR